jgi:hypothetical protein
MTDLAIRGRIEPRLHEPTGTTSDHRVSEPDALLASEEFGGHQAASIRAAAWSSARVDRISVMEARTLITSVCIGSQRERLEGFQLDGVLEREDVAVGGEQSLTSFVGMECVELAAAGEGDQLNFERQRLVLIVSAPPAVQQAGAVAF